VPTVLPDGMFSSMFCGESPMSVGGSLMSVTVIVNCFWKVPPCPSSVWTRIA
jgi:hypothetical protein